MICPVDAESGPERPFSFTTRCSGSGPWREHGINQKELKGLPVDALENSYACENAVSAEKTCTFRVGKVILQREIPKEQVQKLITAGKTDLLPKFISKKGRPFSAHLKLEKGKVGFEFAEKAPRSKRAAPQKAATTKN